MSKVTSTHPTIPTGPSGWIGALMQNPAQALMLVGLLSLSGVQVGSLFGEREDAAAIEERLQKEIERVGREDADRALLEKSAECAPLVEKLDDDLDKLARELQARDDDKFAFMSEITLYVERVANALVPPKKEKPPTGARLDEFTQKGTLRGLRRD